MSHTASAAPKTLFICGSHNQTTQLLAVARELAEFDCVFTPYYGTRAINWIRRSVFKAAVEPTIMGERRRGLCLAQLRDNRVPIDLDGRGAPYDLVVTCSDVVVPENVRSSPLVLVQEGMTDPDTRLSRIVQQLQLPVWMAGSTALTGLSGLYDRFCVASAGYRERFASRGAPRERLRVTGIPNFDDCERYRDNDLAYRGYVLACTSDLRETYHRDDRQAFIARVVRIAGGRPIRFKLHPNERVPRASAEIARWAPGAIVHTEQSAETLIANCDVLVTQASSVAFVGLALGKEVHSDLDVAELRRLCPVQNGGRSAELIADVCRELVDSGKAPLRLRAVERPPALRLAEASA
jgi:hypothetical protein